MPRKAWSLPVAAAIAMAVVALTGCKGTPAASQPSRSQAPGVHLYVPSGRYVALGDSFSSGEGVKPFHPETDHAAWFTTPDTCHRSFDAYSQILRQVSQDPAAPKPQSDKDFVACSGAEIQALWHWNADNPSEPPQFDRLKVNAVESNGHAGGPVGLITITMGGNDVGFGKVIKACALYTLAGSCSADQQHELDVNLHWIDGTYRDNAPAGPGCGPGCNPYKACPPGSGCNPENLVQVYRALRQKAPHARILVLGYPREFRPNTNGLSCQSIDSADQGWANTQLTDALDTVIQANIKAANAGIEYVPTISYFQPHEQWCQWGDPDSAFNGFQDEKLGTDYQGYFHPNGLGQRLLAQAVLDKLRLPAPAASPSPKPSAALSCNSRTFLELARSKYGQSVTAANQPTCADGYALEQFTPDPNGQQAPFFFKEAPDGQWTLIEGGSPVPTIACSTIPAAVLAQLGAQCPPAAAAPSTLPSPTASPPSECSSAVFLKVMRSQGATVRGASGPPKCLDGYAEQNFTYPQGPTANYPTFFFYRSNGPLGWKILGGGSIGDAMSVCSKMPANVRSAFALPTRDDSGCPAG